MDMIFFSERSKLAGFVGRYRRRATSLVIFLAVIAQADLHLQARSAAEPQTVILISLDGCRWDYLNRGLTPNIAALARTGVRALSLQPVFPTKTFPNHISLVSGLHPENHGIIANRFVNPNTGARYRIGGHPAVRQSKWYDGEMIWETARRQGVRNASYFWAGTELEIESRQPHLVKPFDQSIPSSTRFHEVLEWLSLPAFERPQLIGLYFDILDTEGHIHGPDSPELNTALAHIDSLFGDFRNRLNALPGKRNINIILVSDHGMTDISNDRSINVDRIADLSGCKISGSGPFMLIAPPQGGENAVLRQLRRHTDHFQAWRRDEIPENLSFQAHPFIPEILLVADLGWSLVRHGQRVTSAATHGYDPYELDMHGIFVVGGPAFVDARMTGTVRTLDIYHLLCSLLNIRPAPGRDGNGDVWQAFLHPLEVR